MKKEKVKSILREVVFISCFIVFILATLSLFLDKNATIEWRLLYVLNALVTSYEMYDLKLKKKKNRGIKKC